MPSARSAIFCSIGQAIVLDGFVLSHHQHLIEEGGNRGNQRGKGGEESSHIASANLLDGSQRLVEGFLFGGLPTRPSLTVKVSFRSRVMRTQRE